MKYLTMLNIFGCAFIGLMQLVLQNYTAAGGWFTASVWCALLYRAEYQT